MKSWPANISSATCASRSMKMRKPLTDRIASSILRTTMSGRRFTNMFRCPYQESAKPRSGLLRSAVQLLEAWRRFVNLRNDERPLEIVPPRDTEAQGGPWFLSLPRCLRRSVAPVLFELVRSSENHFSRRHRPGGHSVQTQQRSFREEIFAGDHGAGMRLPRLRQRRLDRHPAGER